MAHWLTCIPRHARLGPPVLLPPWYSRYCLKRESVAGTLTAWHAHSLACITRSRACHLVASSSKGDAKKWEHDWGLPEDGFDKETAAMVMRLLTVRAVQQVVVQLMEFNQLQAQWLNHFAAENKPSEGNKFVLKLIAEPAKEVMDPITRSKHQIDPQIMAHRILQVREALADNLTSGLSAYASQDSAAVLRTHLAASLKSSSGSIDHD